MAERSRLEEREILECQATFTGAASGHPTAKLRVANDLQQEDSVMDASAKRQGLTKKRTETAEGPKCFDGKPAGLPSCGVSDTALEWWDCQE